MSQLIKWCIYPDYRY